MSKGINNRQDLTDGRLLAFNSIWNLIGLLLPIAVGILAVPMLVHGLGVERFGLLSLVWIVIGYFSFVDLGMGRALTKLVADKLGANEELTIPPLVWTSLLLMLLLGVFGGLFLLSISRWLVHRALNIPLTLQHEAVITFILLAASIPIVTVTSGLRGVLEAQQRFLLVNLIRIPTSIFSFVAPLFVLPFSHSLIAVVGVLVVGRLIGCLAQVFACISSFPMLLSNLVLDLSVVKDVLRFGSWITLCNMVGPAILYSDRFMIGALLSVSAVSYYTVPFDAVSRLTTIPVAISGVLFPAFALSAAKEKGSTELLLGRGVRFVFLLIFPIVLVIVTLAPEILKIWLGPNFAVNSSLVLRWLAAGIFVNCLSVIPFNLLQGIGRPDLTGKVLLIELAISLPAVWIMTLRFGILGAAITWTVRATVETIIFYALSQHYIGQRLARLRQFGLALACISCSLSVGAFLENMMLKCIFLICVLTVFTWITWRKVLRPEERAFFSFYRLTQRIRLAPVTVSVSEIQE